MCIGTQLAFPTDSVEAMESSGLDRKRIVILMRAVLIAVSAYLVLAQPGPVHSLSLGVVILFAISHVVLAATPKRIFYLPHFGPLLVLADTAIILFALSLDGGLSQDLLLAYFFTLFLVSVGESIGQIALGSALVSGLYGYWLWTTTQGPLNAGGWVRLPFFFLVAIFYAALTEQLKTERRQRHEAQQENQHLRFLLGVADNMWETRAASEIARRLAATLEATYPKLRCSMHFHGEPLEPAPHGHVFPLRVGQAEFGKLYVEPTQPRRLQEREKSLCALVAHAAAGALRAGNQADATARAKQVKDEFLSTVSHELRTPIHTILGYVELLGDELSAEQTGADAQIHLERLRLTTHRLNELIEQLLLLVDLRAGRPIVQVEDLSIHQLVADLVPMVREFLNGKPVNFIWQTPEQDDEICTDRAKLRKLLLCVLTNAARFTRAGEIRLSIRALCDRSLECVVTDTGEGIYDAAHMGAVDRLHEAQHTGIRAYAGLGFGLALARELVPILGGGMAMEGRQDTGTKVLLYLPRTIDPPPWTDPQQGGAARFSLPLQGGDRIRQTRIDR